MLTPWFFFILSGSLSFDSQTPTEPQGSPVPYLPGVLLHHRSAGSAHSCPSLWAFSQSAMCKPFPYCRLFPVLWPQLLKYPPASFSREEPYLFYINIPLRDPTNTSYLLSTPAAASDASVPGFRELFIYTGCVLSVQVQRGSGELTAG